MMTTLIPCPHCRQTEDGLEVSQFHQVLNLWHVKCERCTAQVIGGTEQEARTRWNRRHTLHAMLTERPGLVDELLDLFERYHARARNPRVFGKPFFADAEREEALRGMILEWVGRAESSDRQEKKNADSHATLQAFLPIASDHPEAICDDCGGANVVWFAPSEWWNRVVRRPPDIGHPGGDPMLCPRCFILRAEVMGICLVWQVAPETAPQTPIPSENAQ